MITQCPKCGLRYDVVHNSTYCEDGTHCGIGGSESITAKFPVAPEKIRDRALKDIARQLDLHFDGWALVVTVQSEDGKGDAHRVNYGNGAAKALGLLTVGAKRVELEIVRSMEASSEGEDVE